MNELLTQLLTGGASNLMSVGFLALIYCLYKKCHHSKCKSACIEIETSFLSNDEQGSVSKEASKEKTFPTIELVNNLREFVLASPQPSKGKRKAVTKNWKLVKQPHSV